MTKTNFAGIAPREWQGVRPSFNADGRFQADVTCHVCQVVDTWTASKMPGPHVTIAKLRQRGWSIDRRRATCPPCSGSKRKDDPMTKTPQPVLRAVASTAADQATTPPSEAAKVQRRLAYTAVEDAYDEGARRYRPGHTDDTIAATVGCAPKLVASIRDEFFGPAAPPEPPEVAALRADIAETLATARAMRAEGEGMAARATRIEERAAAEAKRLDQLAGDFGWSQA